MIDRNVKTVHNFICDQLSVSHGICSLPHLVQVFQEFKKQGVFSK